MLAGAAGAALVPWRGIEEPLIFLPPTKIYTGNTLLTASMIANEALRILHQKLYVDFQAVDLGADLPKVELLSSNVAVRLPPRYAELRTLNSMLEGWRV